MAQAIRDRQIKFFEQVLCDDYETRCNLCDKSIIISE